MPTPTYTPLAEITLGAGVSTLTFASLPATYRDVVLVVQAKQATLSSAYFLRFNADSGSNYSGVTMWGNGSSAASNSFTGQTSVYLNYNFNVPTTENAIILANIMDYSATDKHKSVMVRSNLSSAAVESSAQRWANTSAITSITIVAAASREIASGSTFALYGIAA